MYAEMEALDENREDRLEAKNTVSGMKSASDKIIGRLDMANGKKNQ